MKDVTERLRKFGTATFELHLYYMQGLSQRGDGWGPGHRKQPIFGRSSESQSPMAEALGMGDEIEESPIEEVRLTIPITDDNTLPPPYQALLISSFPIIYSHLLALYRSSVGYGGIQ
ncbi:hypothetical protein QJS10_CPA08g01756 [Acorus calamus]|uniref:Uncharacterized protein n=1 Tax=Acorus calamus TaxID=4465 RepID=A0AAV9E9J0_ACOCL|nr:hypothetical protein QJS10_CPA08g01756 [Acorus calamus]